MLPGLNVNEQQEISIPYLSDVGQGCFRDGSLRLDPTVAGQGLFPATTASIVLVWGGGCSKPTVY
jgi:hypothetical protein